MEGRWLLVGLLVVHATGSPLDAIKNGIGTLTLGGVESLEDEADMAKSSFLQGIGWEKPSEPKMEPTVTYSDISHTKLEKGAWFHKTGSSYDIATSEWEQLDQTEKPKFRFIQTDDDVQWAIKDNVVAATDLNTPSKVVLTDNAQFDTFSDMSSIRLVKGSWYHKTGHPYDISGSEWASLPADERNMFEAVNTDEDVRRVVGQNLKLEGPAAELTRAAARRNAAIVTPVVADKMEGQALVSTEQAAVVTPAVAEQSVVDTPSQQQALDVPVSAPGVTDAQAAAAIDTLPTPAALEQSAAFAEQPASIPEPIASQGAAAAVAAVEQPAAIPEPAAVQPIVPNSQTPAVAEQGHTEPAADTVQALPAADPATEPSIITELPSSGNVPVQVQPPAAEQQVAEQPGTAAGTVGTMEQQAVAVAEKQATPVELATGVVDDAAVETANLVETDAQAVSSRSATADMARQLDAMAPAPAAVPVATPERSWVSYLNPFGGNSEPTAAAVPAMVPDVRSGLVVDAMQQPVAPAAPQVAAEQPGILGSLFGTASPAVSKPAAVGMGTDTAALAAATQLAAANTAVQAVVPDVHAGIAAQTEAPQVQAMQPPFAPQVAVEQTSGMFGPFFGSADPVAPQAVTIVPAAAAVPETGMYGSLFGTAAAAPAAVAAGTAVPTQPKMVPVPVPQVAATPGMMESLFGAPAAPAPAAETVAASTGSMMGWNIFGSEPATPASVAGQQALVQQEQTKASPAQDGDQNADNQVHADTEPAVATADPHEALETFSDVSMQRLALGNWYHKKGQQYDVTAAEWGALAESEKPLYIAVMTDDDRRVALADGVGKEDDSTLDALEKVAATEATKEQEAKQVDKEKMVAEMQKPKVEEPEPKKSEADPVKDELEAVKKNLADAKGQNVDADKTGSKSAQAAAPEKLESPNSEKKQQDSERAKKADAEDKTQSQMLVSVKVHDEVPVTSHEGLDTFSDISHALIKPGDWYHRAHSQYDVSAAEWDRMPAEDKAKFVAIRAVQDVKWARLDQPIHPQEGPAIAAKDGQAYEAFSDVSHERLVPGAWYHKSHGNYDASVNEYLAMTVEQKSGYALVVTPNDVEWALSPPMPEDALVPPEKTPEQIAEDTKAIKSAQLVKMMDEQVQREKETAELDVEQKAAQAKGDAAALAEINDKLNAKRVLEESFKSVMDTHDEFKFKSSRSGMPLEFGNWYHMMGDRKDLTAAEWVQLRDEDKKSYIAVRDEVTFARVNDDLSKLEAQSNEGARLAAQRAVDEIKVDAIKEAEARITREADEKIARETAELAKRKEEIEKQEQLLEAKVNAAMNAKLMEEERKLQNNLKHELDADKKKEHDAEEAMEKKMLENAHKYQEETQRAHEESQRIKEQAEKAKVDAAASMDEALKLKQDLERQQQEMREEMEKAKAALEEQKKVAAEEARAAVQAEAANQAASIAGTKHHAPPRGAMHVMSEVANLKAQAEALKKQNQALQAALTHIGNSKVEAIQAEGKAESIQEEEEDPDEHAQKGHPDSADSAAPAEEVKTADSAEGEVKILKATPEDGLNAQNNAPEAKPDITSSVNQMELKFEQPEENPDETAQKGHPVKQQLSHDDQIHAKPAVSAMNAMAFEQPEENPDETAQKGHPLEPTAQEDRIAVKPDISSVGNELNVAPSSVASPAISQGGTAQSPMSQKQAAASRSEPRVPAYYSDVSNVRLKFGNWYHKLGEHVDVTGDEAFPRSDFVVINDEKDMRLAEFERTHVFAQFSDISNTALKPGHWFRNTGIGKDITDAEYRGLSHEDKAGYKPINTASEVFEAITSQADNQFNVAGQPPSNPESTVGMGQLGAFTVRSSMSGNPLKPGDWYHKTTGDYDVSLKEFKLFSAEEQMKYLPVSSHMDAIDIIKTNQQRSKAKSAPVPPPAPEITNTPEPDPPAAPEHNDIVGLPSHMTDAMARKKSIKAIQGSPATKEPSDLPASHPRHRDTDKVLDAVKAGKGTLPDSPTTLVPSIKKDDPFKAAGASADDVSHTGGGYEVVRPSTATPASKGYEKRLPPPPTGMPAHEYNQLAQDTAKQKAPNMSERARRRHGRR